MVNDAGDPLPTAASVADHMQQHFGDIERSRQVTKPDVLRHYHDLPPVSKFVPTHEPSPQPAQGDEDSMGGTLTFPGHLLLTRAQLERAL
eukprot:8573123-Pyramimonas_sp.AAC.1